MEWIAILITLYIISEVLLTKSRNRKNSSIFDPTDRTGIITPKEYIQHKPSTPTPEYDPHDFIPFTDRTQLMFISREEKLAYMKSPQWQALKQQRSIIANHQCEVEGCTETHNLELHHTTYIRLTQEHIDDLRLLCPNHHQEKHDELGYDRTTYYPIN